MTRRFTALPKSGNVGFLGLFEHFLHSRNCVNGWQGRRALSLLQPALPKAPSGYLPVHTSLNAVKAARPFLCCVPVVPGTGNGDTKGTASHGVRTDGSLGRIEFITQLVERHRSMRPA